ncbi:MAG: hypothetical protein ACQEWD_14710 [Bacteroidota bacterium]
MKVSITSRDLKFFMLGILATFIFITIYDWEENVESFKKGYLEGRQDYSESQEK